MKKEKSMQQTCDRPTLYLELDYEQVAILDALVSEIMHKRKRGNCIDETLQIASILSKIKALCARVHA